MWPKSVSWESLKFGIEIEFVGGEPERVELLPGWIMSLDEHQIDEFGYESGSELKPPPMLWEERDQIRVMLDRLKAQGARVNWSCGLHVHVGIEPWGQEMVLPLIDAALLYQHTIQAMLQTSPHRLMFCPPVTPDMREKFLAQPGEDAVRHHGRPQSHRCGMNIAAWFDIGTVEIRYANASLDYDDILRTIELCLQFIAAIGAGRALSPDPFMMAQELAVPSSGYPAPLPPPQWYQERLWLEDCIIPAVSHMAAELVPGGEIHHILPVHDGILVVIEVSGGKLYKYVLQPPSVDWKLVRKVSES